MGAIPTSEGDASAGAIVATRVTVIRAEPKVVARWRHGPRRPPFARRPPSVSSPFSPGSRVL